MDSEVELKHLRWGCRRGMLELDLFLLPFFDNEYQQLTKDEKETFHQLLQEQDTFLQAYFLEQDKSDDQNCQKLIDKIIRYRKTHPQSL